TTQSSCSQKSTLPQQLVGFTCLENDRFFTLKDTSLFKDDIVRFEKVGAYTMSLSPLFISFFPAVYIMHTDGTISCGREKWGANEFMQLSKL
ncbi:MAG: diaminopimelate decarboxylase, partial [Muribaculaceae bacterium]